MRARWSRHALEESDRIAEYIAFDSEDAAAALVATFRDMVERLRHFPYSGREGRVHGTREWIVPNTPYIIVYRVKTDAIEVADIVHARTRR